MRENIKIIEVKTGLSVSGFRFFRFFFDIDKFFAAFVEYGDTETFRVWHFFEKYRGSAFKLFDGFREVVLENIVSQDNSHVTFVCKILGIEQGVGDAAVVFVLQGVREFNAEFFTRT